MTQVRQTFISSVALLALGLGGASATAATWAINNGLAGTTCGNTTNTNVNVGSSCNVTAAGANGTTLKISGLANTGDAGGGTTNVNTSSGTAGFWRAANMTAYGGKHLSIGHSQTNQDAGEGAQPEHAFDNQGRTDAALFSFGTSTALSQVTFGWSQTDLDFTVLAWTGDGAPTAANFAVTNTNNAAVAGAQSMVAGSSGISSKAGTNMVSGATGGWALIGNYAATVGSSAPVSINTGVKATTGLAGGMAGNNQSSVVSSSYWLIMAYNSAFGTGTNLSMGNDYFKLQSVSGNAVSEPGAFALTLLALGGVAFARRRRA